MKETYNYIDKGTFIRFIGNSCFYKDYPKYNFYRLYKVNDNVDDMYFDGTLYKKIIKEYNKIEDDDNRGIIHYNIALIYQLKAKKYNKMVYHYNLSFECGVYTGFANLYKHYFKRNKTLAKKYLKIGVDMKCIVAIADYSYLLLCNNNYVEAEEVLREGERIDINDIDIAFNYIIFYAGLSNNILKCKQIDNCREHIEINILLANDELNTLGMERIYIKRHLKNIKKLRVKEGKSYFIAVLFINYLISI